MANKTREAAGLQWFLSRNGPQLMQKGYNQVILLALLLGGAQCDLYETIFTHATHIQYNKVCSLHVLGSAALSQMERYVQQHVISGKQSYRPSFGTMYPHGVNVRLSATKPAHAP